VGHDLFCQGKTNKLKRCHVIDCDESRSVRGGSLPLQDLFKWELLISTQSYHAWMLHEACIAGIVIFVQVLIAEFRYYISPMRNQHQISDNCAAGDNKEIVWIV